MEENKLICQCCGMPLSDEFFSIEKDGKVNKKYCKWCYSDGNYTYNNIDDLLEVCVKHMVSDNFSEKDVREYMSKLLPNLEYWKNK